MTYQEQNKQKINLAFVLCSLNFGGAEKLVLDLIKNLDKQKFNIHLLTIKGSGDLLSQFQETRAKIILFDKKSKIGLKTIWQLFRYFKKEKIEIVHTHLFAGDTWGRIAACLARVPVIISTEHNVNLDEGYFKKLIKRILSHFTKKIIAVSAAVKDYQIKTEKIPAQKIEVIYNGINLQKFPYFTDYVFHQATPTLGIIGRLEVQKGHLLLLQALSLVCQKHPAVKLMIVGQGSEQNNIQTIITKLGMEKSVIWQKPQADIIPYLAKLDLLVAPSLWEGLGIVVLEALACGVPVIASKVDGIKEIIVDGKNGFLFEKGNQQELAAKIINLINHPENLEQIRKSGSETIKQKFDIVDISQKYQKIYLDLYENIINQ